jgi:hypothetical protein
MRLLCLLLFLAFLPSAFGESKLEAELRIKLAASEAARLSDKAVFAAALSKLTAGTTAAVASSKSAVASRASAADLATRNAASAKDTADTHATEGREAVAAVGERVAVAQESSDKGYHNLLYAQGVLLVTGLLGFLRKEYIDRRDRKWREIDEGRAAAAKAHQEKIIEKLDVVGGKADAAADKADAAYEVGNTVNLKLETIGVRMADGKPLGEPHARRPRVQRVRTAGGPDVASS